MAEAAYDIALLPAEYSTPTRIVADPSKSSACFDREYLDFGFVTRRDGVTYVVFRGTHDVEEWADDACALLVAYKLTGRIHKGFRDLYDGLRDSVASALKDVLPGERITVIGHSLGAALATQCAREFGLASLVTFGGPRVGDETFANAVERLTLMHLRIVNARDIVCHIPMRPLYSHAGGTVTFAGKSLDWHTAHSLAATYGPMIEAMPEEIQTEPNQR